VDATASTALPGDGTVESAMVRGDDARPRPSRVIRAVAPMPWPGQYA
jgi:hypothetical protein